MNTAPTQPSEDQIRSMREYLERYWAYRADPYMRDEIIQEALITYVARYETIQSNEKAFILQVTRNNANAYRQQTKRDRKRSINIGSISEFLPSVSLRKNYANPDDELLTTREKREAFNSVKEEYQDYIQGLRKFLDEHQGKAKHNRYALMLFNIRLTVYRRALCSAAHHDHASRADRMDLIRTQHAWESDESDLRICEGWPTLDQLWAATQHALEYRGSRCSYEDLWESISPMIPPENRPDAKNFYSWIKRTRDIVPDELISRMGVFYQRQPASKNLTEEEDSTHVSA